MKDTCPICNKDMQHERRYSCARQNGKLVNICHTHKAHELPAGMTILYTDLGERQHSMPSGGYAPYSNSFAR